MKRISNTPTSLSRQYACQLLCGLRTTHRSQSPRPHGNPTDGLPALFVSESATARYLSIEEAHSRRPLTRTLADGDDTIRFCEDHFRPVMERSLQEEFYVLTLDGAHRVLRTHSVTVGLVNMTQVHAREVFRPALLDSAVAIFAVHNHPTGDSKPSEADCKVTRKLAEAGQMLGISLLDHIILARDGSLSLRERHDELFRA